MSTGSSASSSDAEIFAFVRLTEVSGGSPTSNSGPGLTWSMSSFGSSGSSGGGAAVSAPGMFRRPQPLELSKPGGPISFALERSTPAICDAVSVGRTVQTHAAAAATIGAEKLVPERFDWYPLGSRESGTAPVMLTPGAAMSTAGELVEKEATFPDWSVAATVKTCGHAAG